jgi:hypothetical protein
MNTIMKKAMEHGLTIMLIRFSLFFLCFLGMLFVGRYSNFMLRQVFTIGAIAGFVVYAIGRICVSFYKRNKKKHPEQFEDL